MTKLKELLKDTLRPVTTPIAGITQVLIGLIQEEIVEHKVLCNV